VSTLETLRQMVIDEFELDPEKIQPDTDLDTLGVDSFSMVEFIFAVEDKFKIQLPDRRVEADVEAGKPRSALGTLRELAVQLDELIAAKKSQST